MLEKKLHSNRKCLPRAISIVASVLKWPAKGKCLAGEMRDKEILSCSTESRQFFFFLFMSALKGLIFKATKFEAFIIHTSKYSEISNCSSNSKVHSLR